MVVYRGRGILVFISALLGLLAGAVLQTMQAPMIVMIIGEFGVAALANHLFVQFSVQRAPRVVHNTGTHEEYVIYSNPKFLFIENRVWTSIFAISGVLFSVIYLFGSGR